jgi:hypothetical protein
LRHVHTTTDHRQRFVFLARMNGDTSNHGVYGYAFLFPPACPATFYACPQGGAAACGNEVRCAPNRRAPGACGDTMSRTVWESMHTRLWRGIVFGLGDQRGNGSCER